MVNSCSSGKAEPIRILISAEDDAGEGYDCDFASPAANIDDHVARRFMHRQTDTNGRSHRLFDQIHFTRSGMSCGVFNCPLFHFGYA
jgi:hypothetical protein